MKIKILLVDDHKILREGLRSLLEKQSDMEVVGEAENGMTAVHFTDEHPCDLVIMDVSMPDMNGIEAATRIKTQNPRQRIMALSMHSDRGLLMKMLKAGASGYLLKDCAAEELIEAIRTLMKNRLYISPVLIDDMVRDYIQMSSHADHSVFTSLTPRERIVLQKLAEGKSVKEIAYDLDVSVKTIESFHHKLKEKLGLRSIAELTKYAIREGITTLE